MVSIVGGGDSPFVLLRARLQCEPPPCSWPATKPGVGAWSDGHLALSPLSSPTEGKTFSLPLQIDPQICNSSPSLWPPARGSPSLSSPAKSLGSASSPLGYAACPLSSVAVSRGTLVGCWMFKRVVLRWFSLSGWVLGVEESKSKVIPTMVVGVLGLSPELVPVLYCFIGVGSRSCILFVFWTARVGSGWSPVLLFVSTGLLCGFPLWYHVTVNRDRLRWCLVLGLSVTPKGVAFYGPSGIIKLLTVLVSSPSTGGSFAYGGNNLWSTLRLDGLVLALYVTIVIVIVSLTLITYHMFIVD